jgi:hypothetical protein
MLVAARDEVDSIDVVCLPESAIMDEELAPLEALLESHGVTALFAGVRRRRSRLDEFPDNWAHCGLSPQLEKGRSQPLEGFGTGWFHVRQSKHHRWSLDAGQIYQYHLGGELHPAMRWCEAVNVPRRVLHFIEFGEGFTVVILICEDLAQNDEVADLIRAVGPTGIMTPLLDGPYPGQGVGLGGQERAAQVRTAVMTTSATSLGWEIITACEAPLISVTVAPMRS